MRRSAPLSSGRWASLTAPVTVAADGARHVAIRLLELVRGARVGVTGLTGTVTESGRTESPFTRSGRRATGHGRPVEQDGHDAVGVEGAVDDLHDDEVRRRPLGDQPEVVHER